MDGIPRGQTLMLLFILGGGGLIAPPRAGAQAPDGPALSGWFHLGVRSLSVAGSPVKYNEDHNLQTGMRLLGLALRGQLAGHDLGLEVQGWGPQADPTSTLSGWWRSGRSSRLTFGGYNTQYVNTNSAWVEAFDLPGVPLSFNRRGRWAEWVVQPGSLPQVRLRYDSLRRSGMAHQVWNIQREKHAALSPIDDRSSMLTVSTSIPVATAALNLSYSLQRIDNTYGATVADTSFGLEGHPSTLYDYRHLVHDRGSLPIMKASTAVPLGRGTVRAGGNLSSGTINKRLDERELGLNFAGAPLDRATQTRGRIDHRFLVLDAGAALRLPGNLTADFSLRRTDLEMSGTWDPEGSARPVRTRVTSDRLMARGIWRPMRGVSVDLGGARVVRRYEPTGADTLRTVTDDWVGGFTYSRQEWFKLRVTHSVGDVENPLTRLSATDRNRTRATLTTTPLPWLTASVGWMQGRAFRYYSHRPEDPEYLFNTRIADQRSGTVALELREVPALPRGLEGGVTYTRGRLGVRVPVAAYGPPFPTEYIYRDITYAVTGQVRYPVADHLRLEAWGEWYRARGQWPLYRFSRRAGIARDMGAYTLLIDWRMVSLHQLVHTSDDYDASMIMFGLRRAF